MKKILIILITVLIPISCSNKNNKIAQEIVDEWVGKKIQELPLDSYAIYTDTTIKYLRISQPEYSIVSYVDSAGSESCKLHLYERATFIKELSKLHGKSTAAFLMIVHPANEYEFIHTIRKYGFHYPVYIDRDKLFDKINHFPTKDIFHTFLINKSGKILFVGDPIENIKVKQAIFNIIQHKSPWQMENSRNSIGKISLYPTQIKFGTIKYLSKSVGGVKITNEGKCNIYIQDIKTSCGCMKVEYQQRPIRPNESTNLTITYNADNKGYFRKEIKIYCNADSSPYNIIVEGTVE